MEEQDKKILRSVEPGNGSPDFVFFCPGCKNGHGIWTTDRNSQNATWSFNGNMEKPTFSPSILIKAPMWVPPVTTENYEQWKKEPWEQKQVETVCHSFVRDGMIQFLDDCSHELKGQTVPLEPF